MASSSDPIHPFGKLDSGMSKSHGNRGPKESHSETEGERCSVGNISRENRRVRQIVAKRSITRCGAIRVHEVRRVKAHPMSWPVVEKHGGVATCCEDSARLAGAAQSVLAQMFGTCVAAQSILPVEDKVCSSVLSRQRQSVCQRSKNVGCRTTAGAQALTAEDWPSGHSHPYGAASARNRGPLPHTPTSIPTRVCGRFRAATSYR
jgi:hypothetical protein